MTIEQQIAYKQTELVRCLEDHNKVEQACWELKLKIHDLTGKKKLLEKSLDDSNCVIKKLNIEIKQLTAEFWRNKNDIGA